MVGRARFLPIAGSTSIRFSPMSQHRDNIIVNIICINFIEI